MLERYITINRTLRSLRKKIQDGIQTELHGDNGIAIAMICEYIRQDVREIKRLWPPDLPMDDLNKIERITLECDIKSFDEIDSEILNRIEDKIDKYFSEQPIGDLSVSILEILHPVVIEAAYSHFRSGRFRDAVFNAIVAVFDLIRSKTGIDKDGSSLVGEVFSINDPKLVFSDLETESGRNDQKGFLQILQGAYIGIRNPKAHSLQTDLDRLKAAQYLVFASLLARRIDEARIIEKV